METEEFVAAESGHGFSCVSSSWYPQGEFLT